MAFLDETGLAELWALIKAEVAEVAELMTSSVVTGTYTGKGLYGEENKNSLTFDRKPVLVIVGARTDESKQNPIYVFANPQTSYLGATAAGYANSNVSVNYNCLYKVSGNTLYWYTNNTSAVAQANQKSTKYYYTAILV